MSDVGHYSTPYPDQPTRCQQSSARDLKFTFILSLSLSIHHSILDPQWAKIDKFLSMTSLWTILNYLTQDPMFTKPDSIMQKPTKPDEATPSLQELWSTEHKVSSQSSQNTTPYPQKSI